jgi:hypothetical protein
VRGAQAKYDGAAVGGVAAGRFVRRVDAGRVATGVWVWSSVQSRGRRSPRGTGVRARSAGGAADAAERARRRAWARVGSV